MSSKLWYCINITVVIMEFVVENQNVVQFVCCNQLLFTSTDAC